MPTVRLRHTNPLGEAEYPMLGRVGEDPRPGYGAVKPGEEIEVDADVAGEAPGTWREATAAELAEGCIGLVTREAGEPPNVRREVLSPGSGLLGTRNFEAVKPSRASRQSTTATTSTEA